MYILKKFVDEWVRDITSLGGLPVYAVLFLFFLLSGNYLIAEKLVVMFIAIMVVTYAVKSVYFKARPDNRTGRKGASLLEKADLSSFPSVHAARITALGVLFSLTYPTIAVTVLSMLIVAAVCVSRVILERHYFSDVAAGFVLGLIVGYTAFLFL